MGPLMFGAIAFGSLVFVAIARVSGLAWPAGGFVLLVALLVPAAMTLRGDRSKPSTIDALPLAALLAIALPVALLTLVHIASYVGLRADLLSFSESPFLADIMKFRTGRPVFTPVEDNNSYPYTPGAPITVWALASLAGAGDSIPALRAAQFGLVLLAAGFGVALCDALARLTLGPDEYRHRPLWIAAWMPLMVLAVTEPRFNLYTHSLHNDGFALLVSMVGFWLAAHYMLEPRARVLIAMAVLPGIGFFIKQNQLSWGGVFFVFLLAARAPLRHVLTFMAVAAATAALVVLTCWLAWGEPFRYWIFEALGSKQISLARSARHLFLAGAYGALGLAAGWTLALGRSLRTAGPLWLTWAMVFGLAALTSGIGFQVNHLGPGVVAAIAWGLVAIVNVWPGRLPGEAPWRALAGGLAGVAAILLAFGSQGMVREPVNPVPRDFERYVAAIEAEARGHDLAKVLIDTGSWLYFPHNLVMKDRSAPVSLHVGSNQPEVNSAALSATIARIRGREYERILARQLDTGESWYDFQDRGSGVKAAMLEHYQIVRRIPAVRGITTWWPVHLVSEVVVLEPRPDAELAHAHGAGQ
jgi:hypothetical protein